MTLDDILQHIYSLVNKDQSGNTYNISRFNNDLLVANIEMFSWYYGLPQGYQPGAPYPPVQAEVTKKITDSLRHLLVNMGGEDSGDPGPLTVTNGIAQIPSDYVHLDYMNYAYMDKACGGNVKYPLIEELTGAQWSNRIWHPESIINEKVAEYPYCTFKSTYIEFRPKDIQRVNFVYWRAPKRPFYDFYIDAADGVVFLPAGETHLLQPGETGSGGQTSGQVQSKTVELEWPEDVHPDFTALILSYVGLNLRSSEIIQMAEIRKDKGK